MTGSTIAISIGIVSWLIAGVVFFYAKRNGKTLHGWKTMFILLSIVGLFVLEDSIGFDVPWYWGFVSVPWVIILAYSVIRQTFVHAKRLDDDPEKYMQETENHS